VTRRHSDVGIALVGCGGIARFTHLRVLERMPGARLLAVVDPDGVARETAARSSGASPFRSIEGAIELPGVEAFVISSPTACHAEQAMAACRTGMHVYIEKPIAADLEGGNGVVAAARATGVTAVVGYNRRLHPAAQQARVALAAGRIGEVRAVRSTFCEPQYGDALPTWKRVRSTGGGVLLDLASHHVDFMRWLLSVEIPAASAHVESRASEMDTAWVRWSLGSIQAQGFYAFGCGPIDVIEVIGDDGVLVFDRVRGTVAVRTLRRRGYGMTRPRRLAGAGTIGDRMRRLVRSSHDESFALALTAFVRAVAERPTEHAQHLATAEDGVRALEAVLLAEASCGY
jgi:myo-inositol 2-dehydrogenase / D-chiro-inositol 1-dehydrogenase